VLDHYLEVLLKKPALLRYMWVAGVW
jgi:hypothetical protein